MKIPYEIVFSFAKMHPQLGLNTNHSDMPFFFKISLIEFILMTLERDPRAVWNGRKIKLCGILSIWVFFAVCGLWFMGWVVPEIHIDSEVRFI